MNITTQAYNFTPDTFELERIKRATRSSIPSWDDLIDLANRNILYDIKRAMWVRVPEPDFDRRREAPHD